MYHIRTQGIKFSILFFECFMNWGTVICIFQSITSVRCEDWFLLSPILLLVLATYIFISEKLRNLTFSYSPSSKSNFQKTPIQNKSDFIRIMAEVYEKRRRRSEFLILNTVIFNHFHECRNKGCKCRILEEGTENKDNLMNSQSFIQRSLHSNKSPTRSFGNIFPNKNSKYSSSNVGTTKKKKSLESLEIEDSEGDASSVNQQRRGDFSEKSYFEFLKGEVWRMIELNGPDPQLYILMAYIDYIFLKNKFIALYDLMNASETDCKFLNRFLIFRFQYIYINIYIYIYIDDELRIQW